MRIHRKPFGVDSLKLIRIKHQISPTNILTFWSKIKPLYNQLIGEVKEREPGYRFSQNSPKEGREKN